MQGPSLDQGRTATAARSGQRAGRCAIGRSSTCCSRPACGARSWSTLDLDQVEPNTPAELRQARQGRITRVQGKGKTERTVFLSADARLALADYLERERPRDASEQARPPLFLSAAGIPARVA